MARYKLLQDAFMPVRPGDICRRLAAGAEVTLPNDHLGLGPHLEPLDEPARAARAAYDRLRPGATLDPTSKLPLGRDPLAEPMEISAAEEVAELREQNAAMQARMDEMAEQVAALSGGKKRKGD